MGRQHSIEKMKRKLADYIGGRHEFTATLQTRSKLYTEMGVERTSTRYLLKNVMLRDNVKGKNIQIDHCWVSCPFLDNKYIQFPCTIHFTAVVVPYTKLNFKTSLGLAGIADVNKRETERITGRVAR